MVRPHEIYIEQLALPLGGCPMWGSMHPKKDPVDIADVGYLSDNGGWIKLFNLRTESDPKKLPSNHQPGSLVLTDEDIEMDIFKGPRYSNSIRKLGGSINVQGKAEAGFSYECAEEKGAILFVAEDAVTRDALDKVQFVKLIQENIENWMEFANRKGRDVRRSDLVLVTGYVRTTTWVAAVFEQKSQWCKFTMGGVFPAGGANLELWGSIDVNASAWTGGPEEMKTGTPFDTKHFLKHMASDISSVALLPKDDPRHQCVVIRGYRIASRKWLLPFKKNKLLKGIEVLKGNLRNLAGVNENNYDAANLFNTPQPANPATHTVDTSQTVIGTDIPTTIDASPERISDTVYQVEGLQGSSTNDNEINVIPSESSSRGGSSNRRGRGTRRTRRRGCTPAPGGNHGNGRRDGGAGAGGSTGAGHQSSFGGAANSGGKSPGTCNADQQKGKASGNLMENHYGSVRVTDNLEGIESESEAASEFESESSGSGFSGDSVEVTSSPWDIFLEYLLQTEENANHAIIHDDDFSILGPIEVKSASELRTQLQVLKPRVYLNGSVGMLKPTALEFFRPTGYFCQTDPEGLMAYFPEDIFSNPAASPGPDLCDDPFLGSNRIYTFSDYQENPEILFATLKKIYIHAHTHIYSIQCEYQGLKRKVLLGNKHGNSGEAPLYVFELNSDEYIVKVRGRSGEYIEQLQFFTNKGRVSSTYGGSGGRPFVWFVDEQRYPNSPGLHHFEGTCENYIRTLKACFPIYPWFEDGTQTNVSESEGGNGSTALNTSAMFTVENVYDIVIFSEFGTEKVQHIRVDAALKLLRKTESQAYIRHRFGKLLEMLNSSEPSAIHCASVVVFELARLGGFELEIKNMLRSIRNLPGDKEFYILLQKLSKQEGFKPEIANLLPDLLALLKYSNPSVQLNVSALLGHLSTQPTFQTSFQEVFEDILGLLNHNDVSVCCSMELLTNLSNQPQFQPFVIGVLPKIIRFIRRKNYSLCVQTSAASAIGLLVEREEFRQFFKENITVLIRRLTNMLKHISSCIQLSGRNALIKLSQQEEFRSAIVKNLSNIVNIIDNESSSVRTNGVALLGKLSDNAALTTEILHVLQPDIVTPSKPYNQSIWVNVLAVSSTMSDQLKHDERLDSYILQLIGMLEDDNENIRNNSANVIVNLLRYARDPLVVSRLLNRTSSSKICRLNGVNALLTILDEVLYGNAIVLVVNQSIPDLVEMLRSDDRKRVVAVLLNVAKQWEFRQGIIRVIPDIIKLLQQNTWHSPDIRPEGIELLTALSEYAVFRRAISNDLTYLLTLLNDRDRSIALAGLSLLEVLTTDETLVMSMAPLVIPLIKKLFLQGDPGMDNKGIAILLNITKQGEHKNTIASMITEVAFDIANSFIRTEPFFSSYSPAEHILERKLTFSKGFQSTRYVKETDLLRLLSEQVAFQSSILEAIPIFVEAAKEPNHASVYDLLRILSVHGGLRSAIEPLIPFVVDKIESSGQHLQACLDLLWTLSEQAAYQPEILPFASRLVLMMRANSSTPDVRITMAGVLMNLRMNLQTVSFDTNTIKIMGIQHNIPYRDAVSSRDDSVLKMAYYTTACPTVASYPDKYHQPSSTTKSSSRPTLNRSSSHHVPAPAPPALSIKTPSPTHTGFSSKLSSTYSSPQPSGSTRTRSRSFSSPAPAIESLLAYHSHPSDVLINYDLSHPPSQATVIRRSGSAPKELSSSEFDRPATYSPVSEMRITCSYLPWTLTVHPLSLRRNVVTVGDVLENLFRFLRKHVSGEEWHSARKSTQESVRQAWLRRVERQQTHKDREYEKSNGLRRIDFLEKLTVFQGLEPVKGSKNTWLLHVSEESRQKFVYYGRSAEDIKKVQSPRLEDSGRSAEDIKKVQSPRLEYSGRSAEDIRKAQSPHLEQSVVPLLWQRLSGIARSLKS